MAVAIDHHEGSLQEEVELLEAIYIHELTIEGLKDRPSSISLLLHPSTGDEGEKQYVCLTLHISLPSEYPNKIPGIHIRNPRGLSDAHVVSIISNLRELAESRLGSPMLYELIEYAKESLTDNNIPSGACAICLSHFQDSHCFTKTECYHYFHCSCLARYIEYSLRKMKENESRINNSIENDQEDKEIVCPMCRLPITYDLEALKAAPEDVFNDNEASYSPDKKMIQLQREMAKLFDKQFKKGGIINVDEEKNRYLIEIKKAPVQQNTEETTNDDDRARDNDPDPGKTVSANVVVDQNKSTNFPDKGLDEGRRERPSSSRKNRGRGGQHGQYYRNDRRWNERSVGPRNERPRSSNERGFYRGQRDREVNQKTQGAEKYRERQGNHESKTRNDRAEGDKAVPRKIDERRFYEGPRDRGVNQKTQGAEKCKVREGDHESKTKNDSAEGKKTVPREINELKSTNVPEDQHVQEVIVKSDVKSDKPGDNSEATFGVESRNDADKSALKMTVAQKDNIQDTKRTDSGYREKRRDKTTRDREENVPSHKKDFSQRGNELGDQKDKSRIMGTDSRTVKPASHSGETSPADRGKIYNDDRRRRRQTRPKRPEQKDKEGKISLSNGVQDSSSRNDIEKTKPSKVQSQREMTCNENKKPSQSNSKTDDKSAAGIVRPPPGFDGIERKSRGPTGPPPGFENKDSVSGKQPPPGF